MDPKAMIDITNRFNWRFVFTLVAIMKNSAKYEKTFTKACPSCLGIAPHRLVWKLVENSVAISVDMPKNTIAINAHE